VNASASAFPLEDEVQSKIRKVRRFGRNARVVCSVLLAFSLFGCVISLVFIVFGPIREPKGSSGDVYAALASPFTVYARTLAQCGFWLTAGYQLFHLFGNLAAGAIHTSANVRRVRNVGLLWLLFAVLGVVLPVTLDVARHLIDGLPIDFKSALKFAIAAFSGLLKSFFSAGLVLLASWIMEVGLHEKEHADALRRDADLVI
jgi:hypothetical protein